MVSKKPLPKSLRRGGELYLRQCEVRQSPRTVEGKACALNAFYNWCDSKGLKLSRHIGLDEVEAYEAYLFKYRQPRNVAPLCKATIRNRLTAVKMLLKFLFRKGIIKENVAALIELPKVPRQLPKGYLDLEEIDASFQQTLLHDPKGLRDRAVLEFYAATGVRRMELANVVIDDVDMKEGIVTVRKGKGDKDRRIPIADSSLFWVELYLKHVRPQLQKLDTGAELFIDNHGKKYRENQLTRLVSKYVRRAGIRKPGACNLFRHSTATLMHQNGADIRVVQDMLGHADISTTQIYTHVAINTLREVYDKTHPLAQR